MFLYNHYDNEQKKQGSSLRGFWGQMNHYDEQGEKTGESVPGFRGGQLHFGWDDEE